MNYLKLVRDFWRSHEEHSFTTTEIAVYLHLVEVCNICQWKNPFKRNNSKIAADLGISFNTLKNARNKLSQAGLLTFKTTNGSPNVLYTLSNFDKVTNEVDVEVGTKVTNEVDVEVLPTKDKLNKKEKECLEVESNDSTIPPNSNNTPVKEKTREKIFENPDAEKDQGPGQEEPDAHESEDTPTNEKPRKSPKHRYPYARIVELFNEICIDLPRVGILSDQRKSSVNGCLDLAKPEDVEDYVTGLFQKIHESDFLCGRKTDFRATFDFVFRKSSFIKINEGSYDNAKPKNTGFKGADAERAERVRKRAAELEGIDLKIKWGQ